jgi:ribose transport system ATP-binding protein
MIGRPIAQVYPPKPEAASLHPAYLRLAGVSWNNVLKGIDLQVRPGEIVGLGGLDGQGQRELLLALSGVLANVEGEIHVGERLGVPASPKAGKGKEFELAFVPEERKTEGLFIRRSVADNLSVAALSLITRRGAIEDRAEKSMVRELVDALQIKAPDLSLSVATLSGGNQQKVLLGKWLATKPKLLLLMDPTRGVDVGTKQEIYRLFRDLAQKGMAILLYSSDYDELIGLCDRVAVMYDGKVRSVLSGASLNEQQILMDSMNLSSSGTTQNPASVSQDVQLGSYAR